MQSALAFRLGACNATGSSEPPHTLTLMPGRQCRYAPEHLIVNTEDAEEWLPQLENAGSIFLGRWTPESVGDYASGTNHVLPTYGYARMYSGVSLDSFQKKITVRWLSLARDGVRYRGNGVGCNHGGTALNGASVAVSAQTACMHVTECSPTKDQQYISGAAASGCVCGCT